MKGNSYKVLRRTRIVVSALFMLLLTLAILDAEFGATRFGQLLLHAQLIPAILASSALWLILWVVVTISFGRVYCSSVCPLGTLQDIAAHCGRRFGHKRAYHYASPHNGLRFPIPVIVAACLFLGFTAIVHYTDPYAVYAHIINAIARPAAIGFGGIATALALLFIMSAVAWRHGRLLCNTICPAGGLLGLVSRTPIYRVDINTDKCIHCNKCQEVCKSQCINLTDCVVDNSRCVMCMDCTAVCPNDAITVRRGRYRLSTPMMQPTMQYDKH